MCVSSSAMQCRDTTVNLEATNAFLTGDIKTGILKKIGVYCYALQSVQLGDKWCLFNNSDNILKQNEAYHVIIAQSHTAHAAITGSD